MSQGTHRTVIDRTTGLEFEVIWDGTHKGHGADALPRSTEGWGQYSKGHDRDAAYVPRREHRTHWTLA